MSKNWITPEGKYVSGYRSNIAPQNAIEVPTAPESDTDIWDGVKWNADPVIKAEQEKEASKQTGIEILGVMCSATKADQMGLTAVGLDYSMTTARGGTFADTKFNFGNGNTLVITAKILANLNNCH